jgi:GTPase SAR1 family protein
MSKKPTVLITVGMAGSGKTTFLHRLNHFLIREEARNYHINLDPAILPDQSTFSNLDIRDTIDYKKLMADYQLGPNGAILTALNLFSTKMEEMLAVLGGKSDELEYEK